MYSVTLGSCQIRSLESNAKTTFDFLKRKYPGPQSDFASPSPVYSGFQNDVGNFVSPQDDPPNHSSPHDVVDSPSLGYRRRTGHSKEEPKLEEDFLNCVHILYETGLQLSIDRCICDSSGRFSQSTQLRTKPSFQVDGKIYKPLRLELSTKTYNQVLETVDALSGPTTGYSTHIDQNEAMARTRTANSLNTAEKR